jgi:uncharacterized repeat protein (TIGR03803 family)
LRAYKNQDEIMKTHAKTFLLLAVLTVGLAATPGLKAQTFTTLYNFTVNDGADLRAGLILSGNRLYGTAYGGGSSRDGTLFAININDLVFTSLYSFTGGSDGASPSAGLILSGSTLYGTAQVSGSGEGTVFAVPTDGMMVTPLHNFRVEHYDSNFTLTNGDGADPSTGLILSSNMLYGTALQGGTNGNGTVFGVNTNGTSFTVLHTFTALSNFSDGTNSDGAQPSGGLILAGNALYGTTSIGGSSGEGTVFAINLV